MEFGKLVWIYLEQIRRPTVNGFMLNGQGMEFGKLVWIYLEQNRRPTVNGFMLNGQYSGSGPLDHIFIVQRTFQGGERVAENGGRKLPGTSARRSGQCKGGNRGEKPW